MFQPDSGFKSESGDSVSFIEKSKHRDEKNITNPIPVFKELVQDQVKKKGVAIKFLVTKVILEEV